MLDDALQKLRLDRRLARPPRLDRAKAELARALAALPDVAGKAADAGAERRPSRRRAGRRPPAETGCSHTGSLVIKASSETASTPGSTRLFPFLFWRRSTQRAHRARRARLGRAPASRSRAATCATGGLADARGGFFDLVDGVVARHQGTRLALRRLPRLDARPPRRHGAAARASCVHYAARGEPGTSRSPASR